jgi:hypothetical protein
MCSYRTLDYIAYETSSSIVDIIQYNMKTKHLLVAAFSMGFIIILISNSNTGMAFAIVLYIHHNTTISSR